MFRIYKAMSPSGKVYVGLTHKSLHERQKQHLTAARSEASGQNRYFYKALRKYGSGFVWEILEDGIEGREQANSREQHFIALFRSNEPSCGYNGTSGGDALTQCTEAVRQKMSVAARARGMTPKQLENLQQGRQGDVQRQRAHRSPRFAGKTHTQESRALMSRSQAQVPRTAAWMQKIKAANKYPVLRSDGVLFDSAADAARQMGLSPDAVAKSMRQQRPCAGYTFQLCGGE